MRRKGFGIKKGQVGKNGEVSGSYGERGQLVEEEGLGYLEGNRLGR